MRRWGPLTCGMMGNKCVCPHSSPRSTLILCHLCGSCSRCPFMFSSSSPSGKLLCVPTLMFFACLLHLSPGSPSSCTSVLSIPHNVSLTLTINCSHHQTFTNFSSSPLLCLASSSPPSLYHQREVPHKMNWSRSRFIPVDWESLSGFSCLFGGISKAFGDKPLCNRRQ